MKTTIEIPDRLFRRAKVVAAERGIPLRELVTEALADKLGKKAPVEQPWMQVFGKLRRLRMETARINAVIAEEFDRVEMEEWK